MRHQTGFSLIEMAIVMVIVAAMIGGLLIPMTMQVQLNDIRTAKNDIEEIKEAILGFLIIHRRLPCPAQPSADISKRGVESPDGGEICTDKHGFVPAVSLGLSGNINSDGFLLDPWGNPYRYSVAEDGRSATCDYSTAKWDFTTRGEINNVGFNCLAPNLQVCTDASCTSCSYTKNCPTPPSTLPCKIDISCPTPTSGQVIATGVPVVIFSMGKNWAGTLTSPSTNETENAGETSISSVAISGVNYQMPLDRIFVKAPYKQGDATDTSRFDDIVDWISPNVLYNRMVMAGIYP